MVDRFGKDDWFLGWSVAVGTGQAYAMSAVLSDSTGVALGTSGNPVVVNDAGGSTAVISATNSSVAPLGVSGVFTGTSVATLPYGSIIVNVFSNVASATDGLSVQQSSDGTNWDILDVYTVAAGASTKVVIPRQAAFARVVYTNGGTLQTTFRLQTLLAPQMPVASALRPADAMSIQNDFPGVLAANVIYNGTTLDMMREVVNATNSTGTGITAVGMLAQLDDVTPTAISENSFGNVRMSTDRMLLVKANPYPNLSTPLSAGSAVVANAAAVATLTGTATTTVYISGFEVTGAGATVGLPVTVTVAGLLGGTRSYIYSFMAGALLNNTPLIVQFNPPLPASAVNTPIVVTCPAGGTGATSNTANAHGYYQ